MTDQQKEEKLPVVLTVDELDRILNMLNPTTPIRLRNLCMLRILANTGLKPTELVLIQARDINWMSGQLMARDTQGNYDRTLWLGEYDLDLIRKWRVARPPATCEEFFTTMHGTPVNSRYLRQIVARLAKRAGITKRISTHTLRHTFAADLYRKTKNLRLVQKALGFKTVEPAKVYERIIKREEAGEGDVA